MAVKIRLDDESTSDGYTKYNKNNTLELEVKDSPICSNVQVSIDHFLLYDQEGMFDCHKLSEVEIHIYRDGDPGPGIVVNVIRENFHPSFQTRGILFQGLLMNPSFKAAQGDDIANFVDALRKFICDYCEKNEIAIFDN